MNTTGSMNTAGSEASGIDVRGSERGSLHIGRLVQGLVSGLLLGLGIAVMLILYAKAAAGTKAPWVVMAVMALIGAAIGLLPSRGDG